jgi:acyl-CoA thioester hydrolase
MVIRVYYEDTDCGNVVYYAKYLGYMERSRTELLRDLGVDLAAFHARGYLFAVTEAHVFYKSPARYNDLLELESSIDEMTPATVLFTTLIRRAGDERVLVKGAVRLACIGPDGKACRIPEEIKKRLADRAGP